MIDPALTTLMRMLMRAGLRQAGRLIRKPSGAILTLVMLVMVSFGLIPSLVFAWTSEDPSHSIFATLLTGSIPLVMYAMAAAMIVTGAGDSLLELRPPELQFVLAGPFTNSHILSYRLLTLLLGWIPLSACLSLFMLPYFGSFLGGFLCLALGGPFIVLISFQYTLVKPNLSSVTIKAIRWISLLSLLVVALETSRSLWNADEEYSVAMISQSINDGWVAQCVSVPFLPFAKLLHGEFSVRLLLNASICTGLVALVALCCYQTNSGFAELAVEGVARRQKKLERIRGGNVYGVSSRKMERVRRVPVFGWFGGVGPVAWSQIVMAIRRTGRLIPAVVFVGVVAAVLAATLMRVDPNVLSSVQRSYAVPIALAASAYLGFLITMTAQTGFSANRRLLTWYQMLPIQPISIAIGMVAGTGLLLVALQLALCLPALVVTSQSWIECASLFFAGVAFSIAFASTINFVSATTGLRPMPQGTPDVFQGARAMIYMFVLAIALIPTILFGGVMAGLAGAMLGLSWTVCSIAAGSAMLSLQPILWWFAGERFVQSELDGD
ncbi:putative ABC exporter domain-containing protein [Novipirellula artificiosorum]|uniref:Uncharacterized protein n=1 Tax=Novipirellula artificiosorum TaxID=2528016 RepID=A0A5C6DGY3_9BACT|nr:putative ABC exporter domain-containing protein [Novipirellula artificiosorum]TWU34296.1 hypothetical protein Poly41_44430 [Novipirellula artificiosorum]